ncbi:MFS transporter [Methylobacterium sp. J-043]|uniref:MFS transporter n=1 Tax=Methylobacteriaceae TaxID=119045 RepID=UPI00074F88EA|nr:MULTISPECIES: MFS transporter [Methylobacteriaceae]MCJ2029445.1 MFS transporter [Methylobacterium sp. J-043]MDF9861182.1 DHA1 family inner membrane transport protein [Methylorubrum pseudosasae]MDH6639987.1 DHA1 family inner membrane transport protein [Methylobacterium sp. SuP10 SLI 274]AMB44830.1 MFS transporter [Methylobacterium sp. AMS5]MCP1551618.1 DHA1 family inner membrane transport protein [Methylorubrum zatmanii]
MTLTEPTENRPTDPEAAEEIRPVRAAPGRHPTLVLLALAVGGFAIGTTEFAAMSLLPAFAPELGIDAPTAGHVISAYALGVVVGAPLIAVLAARFARRTLLVGLMLLFAVGNALSALAPDYGWMLAFRFIAGLPHGAYFGVASLVAASLVPRERRTQAVSRVILGLSVATIVGVPLANGIGQVVGWRWSFALVAALATLTAILVQLFAPLGRPVQGASALRELGALKRGQVWLTLMTGAIGFGGLFSVYTYLASTLLEVTHASPVVIPAVLAVFGLGLTAGTFVCAWAGDRALMPAIGLTLLWGAGALALYPLATGNVWTMVAAVFLIGSGGGLSSLLQARLMDVAEDAQTMAAALNHSAFNTANALGPWLAGLALAAGYGLPTTGVVGMGLALSGFAIWAVSYLLDRRAVAVRR